jgi:hypothetical protein
MTENSNNTTLHLHESDMNKKLWKQAYNLVYYQEKKADIAILHKRRYFCEACEKEVLIYGKVRHESTPMHEKNVKSLLEEM